MGGRGHGRTAIAIIAFALSACALALPGADDDAGFGPPPADAATDIDTPSDADGSVPRVDGGTRADGGALVNVDGGGSRSDGGDALAQDGGSPPSVDGGSAAVDGGSAVVDGGSMLPEDGGSVGADGGSDGGAIGSDGGTDDYGVCATGGASTSTTPVDLILAIDQSASMGQEIPGILTSINRDLVPALEAKGLDWRVVLVGGNFCLGPPLASSADCYGSNLPRYFHASAAINNSDALTQFLWTYDGQVRVPNSCNRSDQPAVRWKDHLRLGALKVFIVFTDDDPTSFSAAALGCSNCAYHNCPTFADRAADWGGADFPTELYRLAPAGMFGTPQAPKWIFHSVVGVDRVYQPNEAVTPFGNICDWSGNSAENTGVEYQKLSRLTGGLRFPVCNTDYSPVFREIAGRLEPLPCRFTLSGDLSLADPDRVRVTFTPAGQAARELPRDDHAPCATGANGWQFANNRAEVVLCGATCDDVRRTTGSVRVEVACQAP